MICFTALPLRGLALLLVIVACYVVLTPVSAVETDESQIQAMIQASQQSGFGWTVEALRTSCESGYAGVQSCNETGFVTSLNVNEFLTGVAPPAFSGLLALKSMTLFYSLNGTLPSSWSSLTQLETLVLGGDAKTIRLTGALPESWSAMTKLKTLEVAFVDPDFQSVSLIASTPPSWLGNLDSVLLNSAYWPNSTLPASIGTSITLKSLELFQCVFKGDFPTGLLTNDIIETLHLSFDSPTAFGAGYTFPSDFSAMINLEQLIIFGGSFTGSLPTALPFPLREFAIGNMPALSGTIPPSLVNHPSLRSILLREMFGISGALPVHEYSLYSYALSGLSVTGTIPSSILGLPAYITLKNLPKISGPFPTLLSTSSSPCRNKMLLISDINLQNTPFPIGVLENCADLTWAEFINTGFTGQLPDFPASRSLGRLVLNSNPFGGTIPIIKLASSAAFSCNNCSLTGVIPPFYLNDTAFWKQEFAGNKLDLCSNSAAIIETGFANKSSLFCDLVGQTPRECGCPDIWPTDCFLSRPMALDCDNLPPDTLVEPSSLHPSTPASPTNLPPAATNLPPIAASPASIPSIALIATMLVIAITF